MFNTLLNFILSILLTVIKTILNIVLLPITGIIKLMFPNIDTYIGQFLTLLNDYLFNGLRFAREVLFNITGINRNLVAIAVLIPLTYFGFSVANAGVRFIVSMYRLYKTGKDE